MKRLVLTLAVALVTALSASAQRLANIQVEARFITDKMVLELGLSNVQRNNIMQLNLSYLDAINSYRDINGKAVEAPQQGVAQNDERPPMETLQGVLLLLSAYRLAQQRLRTQYLCKISEQSGCRTRVETL